MSTTLSGRSRFFLRGLTIAVLAVVFNSGHVRLYTQEGPSGPAARLRSQKLSPSEALGVERLRFSTRPEGMSALSSPGTSFGNGEGPAARTEPRRILQPRVLGGGSTAAGGASPASADEGADTSASASASKLESTKSGAVQSAFERQLLSYIDPAVDPAVAQFGYTVFQRPRPGPVDLPIGEDYTLGSGDEVVVTMWGRAELDADIPLTVGRDGQIRVPHIGPIAVKGLSLKQAENLLKRHFDRHFTNYFLQIRMGRVKDIGVHVIGRVASPGPQRVSSLATLFDALSAAGGITKDGSLRTVEIRSDGDESRRVDLYDYLLTGDTQVDVALAAGDSVVVHPVGARVAILGRVLRPAIYEFAEEEIRLSDVIAMAGGFGRLADQRAVQIESIDRRTQGLKIRSVDHAEAEREILSDGDVVIVRTALAKVENVVYLDGNITQPGRFPFQPGMRVSDLVTESRLVEAGFWLKRLPPDGGHAEIRLAEPYLDYALIRRIDPQTKQETRIAFHLGKALFDADPTEDYPLQAQDTVAIFSRDDFAPPRGVHVIGAVNKPGHVERFEGMRLRDLIRMAGGLRPEAQLNPAILTRIHPFQEGAEAEHLHVDLRKVLDGDEEENLPLSADDQLTVQRVPDYRTPFRVNVQGEVRQPGEYTLLPGQRLTELLEMAGGFTENAYLPGAQLYRESVRRTQQQRMDEALSRLEMEAGVTAQQYTAEAAAVAPAGEEEADDAVRMEQERVRRLIQTIRATPPEGRMVIRIRPVDELRGTADDVELDGEDQLVIPRKPDEVNVIGAVLNQTALLYREGLTVWDYVLQCGGPSASADVGLVFVIRADGTADSSQSIRHRYRWDTSRGRFSRGSLMASELAPGDTVIVPHDLKPKLSKLGLTTAITQIIFQAAMATGVVVALL